MKDELTGPERFAENAIALERKASPALARANHCQLCRNRVRAFPTNCRVPGRSHPLCTRLPGPTFELDQRAMRVTLKEAA